MIRKLLVAAMVLAISASVADARPKKKKHRYKPQQEIHYIANYSDDQRYQMTSLVQNYSSVEAHSRQYGRIYGDSQVVGGRPSGCPRKFCGCAAALYLWGQIKPDLNLAANWIRKFARTEPAPRMAAARSGHVFVLMSHVSGNVWKVYDGNSGGGKTRIHERSIAGYTIVDPNRPRSASL